MKLYIALALAVLLAGLASYSAVQGVLEVSRYKRTVSALEAQLRASQEATAEAMRRAVTVTQKSQEAKTNLEEHLNEHPEWSTGAVPGPVRDSLCSTVRCSNLSAVQPPSGGRQHEPGAR